MLLFRINEIIATLLLPFWKMIAKECLDLGYTGYPPNAGLVDLRSKICEKLLHDNDLEYKVEDIVISNGAKQCVTQAVLAVAGAGDEV